MFRLRPGRAAKRAIVPNWAEVGQQPTFAILAIDAGK
jgi:hypothetical protein